MNRSVWFHTADERLHVSRKFFCIAEILVGHRAKVMPVQSALCGHGCSLLIVHMRKLP